MESKELQVKNFYTCQFCGKEFESKAYEYIQVGVSPVCSYRCNFNVVYRIIKKYNPEQIEFLKDYFKVNLSDNQLYFELTKRIIKEVFVQ